MSSLSREKMILPGLLLGVACAVFGFTMGSGLSDRGAAADHPSYHPALHGPGHGDMRRISHFPDGDEVVVDIPAIEIPEIRIPAIHIPAFRIAAIHIPGFRVPGGEVEAVHVPAVDVPAVHVPEVVVPAVRIPGMRVAGVQGHSRAAPRLEGASTHPGHGWALPEDSHDYADPRDALKAEPEKQAPDKQTREKESVDKAPPQRERSLYGVRLISL